MQDRSDSGRSGEPRRHHYVPQFLLRRFANAEGQVRTADLRTGRTFVQPVRKAAAAHDFNAIWDEAGNRSQRVERLLAELEGYLRRSPTYWSKAACPSRLSSSSILS
jgi:hypothetical protein